MVETGETVEEEDGAAPSLSIDDTEIEMKQEEIRAGAQVLDPGVRLDAEPEAGGNGTELDEATVTIQAAGSATRRRSTRRKKSSHS
jgi:hypothetical protein